MHRHGGVAVGIVSAVIGCKLLEAYPGDGDPADALASGPMKGSPFDTGMPQERLDDPPIDDSIHVADVEGVTIAVPGTAFLVDLDFVADNRNVVGGGIKFPGSDEVQWTLIDGLEGLASGEIQFGYVVDEHICDGLPNLCHAIETTQFAVGRDGNGTDFVVSEGQPVTVVLMCATCESPSCRDLLQDTGEDCFFCTQPPSCRAYFDRCLAEGMPNAGSDEEDLFNTFFGEDGVLWSTAQSCKVGEDTCDKAQENADATPDVCEL